MRRTVFFIAICCTLFIVACSKDDPAPSKKSVLTAVTWRLGEIIENGNVQLIQTCDADNRYKFNADGSITFTEGTNQCGLVAVGVDRTWEFLNNETKIRINVSGIDPIDYKILELTKDVFRVEDETEDIIIKYVTVK
jgi:hypothetical protein